MAYTSDKKPGALTQATVLANTDNVVVEQSGDVKRATLAQVEAKIFDSKTATSTPTGTEVTIVRLTDGNLRQVALSDVVPAGNITNAKVSATAAIADTKLATISTAGKVVNSATTATSANTINAIVARDGSGNFEAGTITATLAGSITGNATGNAGTATTLQTARTIAISGDVTGTATSFNGSANITIPAAITADSIVNADINSSAGIVDTKLATISTAGKVSNSATTATSANTINAIVARDGSGNFSAGTITATLAGNAATATTVADQAITNAKVNDSAAIAGTKISPNFGTQNVVANGSFAAQNVTGAGDCFIIGNDSKLVDINIANACGLYGLADATIGSLKLGSGGGTISGASGNIGIGTTSPATTLHVAGELLLGAGGGEGGQLTLQNAAGNATGSFIDIDSNNLLRIFNTQNTPTIFVTNNVERMRIEGSGNVGIGTNNPTERLDVNGTVKATAFSGPLTGNVTGNLTGTASAIADGSVSTAKIVDGNVTNAKLASDIDAGKLTTGTLPADRIGSSAITTARIADDAVTDDKLSLAANAGEIKKALNADNSPPIYACRAWVNFNGTTADNLTGTYAQSSTTVTVTATAHGHKVGHQINVDATSGTAVDGIYTVATVPDANTFTYTAGTSLTTSGNITLRRRSIRASGNVQSVAYNATGDYSINFTTDMPDANYAVSGSTQIDQSGNGQCGEFGIFRGSGSLPAASSVRVRTNNGAQAAADVLIANFVFFR